MENTENEFIEKNLREFFSEEIYIGILNMDTLLKDIDRLKSIFKMAEKLKYETEIVLNESFEKETGYNFSNCNKCVRSEKCKGDVICNYFKAYSEWLENKFIKEVSENETSHIKNNEICNECTVIQKKFNDKTMRCDYHI